MKHHLRLLLAAGFGAISIGASAAVHDWTVTRIGDFDEFTTIDVVVMNNAGQVLVSLNRYAQGHQRALLYTPGSSGFGDLGSLGGTGSVPTSMNAMGQVVGGSYSAGDVQSHAFIYRDGRMQQLGLPRGHLRVGQWDQRSRTGGRGIPRRRRHTARRHHPPGSGTSAVDMNETGQIVGASNGTDGIQRPFLYSDGRMTAIGPPGLGSAMDINDRGQVLGVNAPYGLDQIYDQRAFLYSDGEVQDLGDLGGNYTVPRKLNELGQVVGWAHWPEPGVMLPSQIRRGRAIFLTATAR